MEGREENGSRAGFLAWNFVEPTGHRRSIPSRIVLQYYVALSVPGVTNRSDCVLL